MPTDRSRRPSSAHAVAEAAFKKAPTKPVEEVRTKPSIPGAKELVSLRLDREVLEHFQADGPGWQDRINEALRNSI